MTTIPNPIPKNTKTTRLAVSPRHQQGSSWILLPWLLFFALAGVFWWFVNYKPASEPITTPTAQVAPVQNKTPELKFSDTSTPAPTASYRNAVQKAAISVVNIYTTTSITHPYANDPVFREFYGNIPQDNETNLGSGVIVSADGYIVTNAHVIDGADEIVVVLSDGQKAKAKVIGTDSESDLAVIKVELTQLTPIDIRKDDVAVGDVVLAIGNPFGVGQTVTQGIVSAIERTGLGVSTFENFIQTDASINPGNSGGALVDSNGSLIGINTMIYSRSGGSMGIGFAIPVKTVEKVMQDIINTGSVSRGWLGVEVGRQIANPTNMDTPKGVLIARVVDNAPAANAGIQAGDIILSIDGVAINSAESLIQLVANKAPNSQVTIDYERDGQKLQAVATLTQRPNASNTTINR